MDAENFFDSIRHIRCIYYNIMQYRCCTDFFYCFRHFDTGNGRKLICQCCGMPLEDATISREPDGTFNEEYCKWCYADGKFKYESPEQLIEFCVEHMASDAWPKEQVRAHMEAVVPQLRHWKK